MSRNQENLNRVDMKKIIKRYSIVIFVFTFFMIGCEDVLDVEPKSELGNAFLATEEGLQTVLNGAYGQQSAANHIHSSVKSIPLLASGIGYTRGGGYFTNPGVPTMNFQFDNIGFLSTWWQNYYTGIRNTNVVINRLEQGEYSEKFRNVKMGEAKALRAYFYYNLYQNFGPVPLITDEYVQKLQNPRATDEETRSLIEKDLTEAASLLPTVQAKFGQITKGAALGLLTKHYLNTKQWQKAVDTGEQVKNLGVYILVPKFADIYSLDNEGHKEAVWPIVMTGDPRGIHLIAILLPSDYPLPNPGTQTLAAEHYLYDSFVATFPDDDRKATINTVGYTNIKGVFVKTFGNNRSVILKYPFNPPGTGIVHTIDMMTVRYADILLSIAEARNELEGPNQESIDLINVIRLRSRAKAIQLGNFASKEALRAHILNERLWEFYIEGMEREDMIRHGVFISRAQQRGVNAKDFHKLFPIPLSEIEANPNIVQNPGY